MVLKPYFFIGKLTPYAPLKEEEEEEEEEGPDLQLRQV